LEIHHKDLKDRKVTHHKVMLVVLEMVDLKVMLVITHKDLQDQRDLVGQVVIRDLLETRDKKEKKVRQHLQDLQERQVLRVIRGRLVQKDLVQQPQDHQDLMGKKGKRV
jgi:hypothetical protein